MYCSAVLNRTKDVINQICLSNSIDLPKSRYINPPRVPATIHRLPGFYAKQITCHRVRTLDRVKPIMTYSDPNRNDNNGHCSSTRTVFKRKRRLEHKDEWSLRHTCGLLVTAFLQFVNCGHHL